MLPKRFNETDDAWILGRDAVSDRRCDADDFLQHFDKRVVFVLAGSDLAGFHAEGGFEVHSLHAVAIVNNAYEYFLPDKERRLWRGVPVRYGRDVLREICYPFCCLDGGRCMMH